MFSLIHGFACITHKGNQVISGLAINILASGLTVTLGIAIFAKGGQTPMLSREARFSSIELPFAEAAGAIPLLGQSIKRLSQGIIFWSGVR
jgi:simple sugar transport system permease protein